MKYKELKQLFLYIKSKHREPTEDIIEILEIIETLMKMKKGK